jgi:hypothetical protein
MSLTFTQPRSCVSPVVLLLFLPVFLLDASPLDFASDRQLIGLGLYVLLVCAVLWAKLVAGTRVVRVAPEEDTVRITSRNALFRARHAVFPLNLFRSVVSYVVPGRFATVRVELIDASGTRALLLATFPAASVASSFWSFPRDGEGESPRNLRISISRLTGLQDGGFLGNRWPGAQVL